MKSNSITQEFSERLKSYQEALKHETNAIKILDHQTF